MSRYSQRLIRKLLDESDNAPNTDIKGDKLEELGRYLFASVPGVEFEEKNILDAPRAHELDLAFWNPQNLSPLSFLDATLIVECKNTGEPLGSMGVGWFVRKLQDHGAASAVLISLSGITGDADGNTSAYSEVLNALIRDRIKILILTRQEILNLRTTNNLVELLRSKYLRLSLRRTVVVDE